jgi:polar amino acid transport system substrate-binding protein
MFRRGAALLLVGGLVVATAACSESDKDDDDTDAGGSSETTAGTIDCSVDALQLVNDGVLTIGTDDPAYPPWFEDNEPSNGKGFEAAVAYAVAGELGFDKSEVTWTKVGFNNAIAPGDKDFDFDVNQVSISEDREKAVDFSEAYYETNQAIVGYDDSKAAGATTMADLKGLKLGAQVGTTSLQFITDVIKPSADPFVYNDNNAAKAALDAKQIDAIVLDLPTAFYVSSAEIEGTKVIAQFPASAGGETDEFGLVFAKGNTLRDCVDEALGRLKDSGDLAKLEQQWLSDVVDAPVIEASS